METKQMELTNVNFYSQNIKGYYVTQAVDLEIKQRSILINIGNSDAIIDESPYKSIAPRKSTILANTRIQFAEALLVIVVKEKVNLGGVILNEGWQTAEDIFGDALKGVPLWRSPQIDLGTIELNPTVITNQADVSDYNVKFKILVNLWYATERTNCVIHNQHPFIEYHTQIHGVGRMQKFRAKTFHSLYEDIMLAPGNTHDLFCETKEHNKFIYPWHQYYSDTDCVWLVTELHPLDW